MKQGAVRAKRESAAPGIAGDTTATRAGWLAAAGAVFFGLLVSGLLLRAIGFATARALPDAAYGRVYSLHGALTLSALFLFMLFAAPGKPSQNPLRIALAVCHTTGVGALVLSGDSQNVALLAAGLCLVTTAVFALVIARPTSSVSALFFIAAAGQALAIGGQIAGEPALGGALVYPLVLAVVAAPTLSAETPRAHLRSIALGAALVFLAARSSARFLVTTPLSLAALAAAVVVAAIAVLTSRSAATAWETWCARLVALLFVESCALTAYLGVARDPHVSATLLPASAMHLEVFVLVFALVSALDRAARTRAGWGGLVAAALGSQVFCGGFAILGARGMPQRYQSFTTPEFATLQNVASAGAALMVAGILVCMLVGVTPAASGTAAPPAARQ